MANQVNLFRIGARVERELAEAVATLADRGDRSVSREVRRALITHIESAGAHAAAPTVVQRERSFSEAGAIPAVAMAPEDAPDLAPSGVHTQEPA